MSDFSRRTEILRYRQLVIDTVSSAYPHAITLSIIAASARMKLVKNVSIAEMEALIQELLSEGILLEQNNRFVFNKQNADFLQHNLATVNLNNISDKELREIQKNETAEEKRLRLIQRRVNTYILRQSQFDSDLIVLKSILPTQFAMNAIYDLLPTDWQYDKRRSDESYLFLCVVELMRVKFLSRCETTDIFYRL